jgi:hypothetical protein
MEEDRNITMKRHRNSGDNRIVAATNAERPKAAKAQVAGVGPATH